MYIPAPFPLVLLSITIKLDKITDCLYIYNPPPALSENPSVNVKPSSIAAMLSDS